MRKVIASVYLSLDGVMEAPEWTRKFFSDEGRAFARAQLFDSDALLLGRVTYQGFAQSWPSITDEDGFADRMNSLPKFVASTTLQEAEWNASIIKGDVAEEVSKLKQQPGQNLLIYGSADLIHSLMQHNLIDEYRLWVVPVVVGSGKRLFQDGSDTTFLNLVEAKTLSSGIVILSYQPAAN